MLPGGRQDEQRSSCSPVRASARMGPRRRWPWRPYKFTRYLWLDSRPERVTSFCWPSTPTTRSCPSWSVYWTSKESNSPSATDQERVSVCGVASSTASSPRWGSGSGSIGLGVVVSATLLSLGAGSERQVELGDGSVSAPRLSKGRAGGEQVRGSSQGQRGPATDTQGGVSKAGCEV